MGGCFPCFGSSEEAVNNGVKEAVKKDSLKDGSTTQSHHVSLGNLSFFFICKNTIFENVCVGLCDFSCFVCL